MADTKDRGVKMPGRRWAGGLQQGGDATGQQCHMTVEHGRTAEQ